MVPERTSNPSDKSMASGKMIGYQTDGAFDLRMSKQQLDSSEVAGALIDLHSLCTTQRVRADFRGVRPMLATHF